MENHRDTGTQKVENYLKLDQSLSSKRARLVPSNEKDWDFKVFESNSYYYFVNSAYETLFQLPAREQNLKIGGELLLKIIDSNFYDSLQISKLKLDLKKTSQNLLKKIEKVESHIGAASQKGLYQSIRKIVSVISESMITINEVPEVILNSQIFKEIKTCQILIHEKGTTNVTSYLTSRDREKVADVKKVKDFNKAFSSLKKSKNLTHNTSQSAYKLFDTVGSFLGQSIELRTHNIILLLTRESFLDCTEKEKLGFEILANYISPYIDTLLEKKKEESTLYYKFIILKNLNFGVSVVDSNNAIVFTNDYRKRFPYEEILNEYDLGDGFKISTYAQENNDLLTDFQHNERINLLGKLLNTLGHELSNPIFGMKLTCDLFLTEDIEDDQKETFADISSNLDRSQNIMNNFSQLYSDQIKEVDLKEIINETLTLAKSEIRFIRKEVHYNDIEFANISSNPTWISQILFNIIINSSQAMSDQPPLEGFRISLTLAECDEFFSIIIQDNGPGIPASFQDKIFQPFFTTKDTGTGLGLIICKNLARKLGGDLNLDTSFDSGARFILKLPR